ncbi:MAG: ABC transporter substrate-binding protein [Acetobacteraceae bacterium]|nr:ABC transporter substrate-binding protein [Acetobacteraceae bacterium]
MRGGFARFGAVVLAAAGLAAGPLPAAPAHAQKAADTLRIAWRDAVATLDPYYNQQRSGLILAHHLFDGLVHRDPESFTLKPLLATSWRYVDTTTLEFELRRGVTFHDGSPFTAEDVAYTVATVLADPAVSVPSNYAWLAGAEVVDSHRVRLKLKRVFPAAMEYVAMVLPIWPRAAREAQGAAAFAAAPIGAGPYRLAAQDGGLRRILLERYVGYYPDSPKGRPAIARLRIDQVADARSELDALLAGDADWIWNFPAEQGEVIARTANLQALRAESMRVGYLTLDAAGRTGIDNPLTRQKVRQAIFHAIDRQAFVRQVVQDGSRVPEAACYPTQFGCDPAAAVRYDYNPDRARTLLAEAGYKDGFDTELVTYALPQWAAAIHGYLKAVGIHARITQLPVASAVRMTLDGDVPIGQFAWGSYSINDVSAFLPQFFSGGGSDYARDPALAALIAQGGASINPNERRKFYSQAIRLISEQAYMVPLNTYVTTYGLSRALVFRAFPDELPRFYLASWR